MNGSDQLDEGALDHVVVVGVVDSEEAAKAAVDDGPYAFVERGDRARIAAPHAEDELAVVGPVDPIGTIDGVVSQVKHGDGEMRRRPGEVTARAGEHAAQNEIRTPPSSPSQTGDGRVALAVSSRVEAPRSTAT